jgi:uncharacterized protein related to proFAR isomerase
MLDDNTSFQKEKKEFVEVWMEWLTITLKEILKGNPSPYKFLLTWGGNNEFIREKILNTSWSDAGVSLPKTQMVLEQDFSHLVKTEHKEIFEKSNLWLLSMILATKEIIHYKNNPVLNILRDFLDKNEF